MFASIGHCVVVVMDGKIWCPNYKQYAGSFAVVDRTKRAQCDIILEACCWQLALLVDG